MPALLANAASNSCILLFFCVASLNLFSFFTGETPNIVLPFKLCFCCLALVLTINITRRRRFPVYIIKKYSIRIKIEFGIFVYDISLLLKCGPPHFSLYPSLKLVIPTPLLLPFFLLYLKILYREIHAIWLTLTSRETIWTKDKKNHNFLYTYNTTYTSSSKIAKKIYDKKTPKKFKN